MNEMADIYRAVARYARKEHKCSECRGVIRPREYYQDISGLWDGRFDHYKRCADCLFLISEMDFRRPSDEKVALGDLYEEATQGDDMFDIRFRRICKKRYSTFFTKNIV